MKFDISDNVYWLGLWSMLAICITSVILGGYTYSYNTNKQILKADTCEKVMAINGSYTEKYIICMGKK